MSNSRLLQEKWAPVLGHKDLPEIKDAYRRQVVATLLENQERAMRVGWHCTRPLAHLIRHDDERGHLRSRYRDHDRRCAHHTHGSLAG